MADSAVRLYQSTDTGAPQCDGVAGSLIAVLDACLVTGYASVNVSSIVVSIGVATVTTATGHGISAVGTTGPCVRIEGATPAELNGDWRVAITGSTTFTFETAVSDQTATGAITTKRAPAGWEKVYAGTNKAAYRSHDVTGTRLYLRVDDTVGMYANVSGYETMSDIDTGTGAFNGGGTGRWSKSTVANTNARAWRVFADSRCVYLFVNKGTVQGNYEVACGWFGDIISNLSADAYGCGIVANDQYDYDYALATLGSASYLSSQLARAHTQIGTAVSCYRSSNVLVDHTYGMGCSGMPYPSPVGNELIAFPVQCVQRSDGLYRGDMPGLYGPAHNMRSVADGTVITGVQVSGSSRDFMVLTLRGSNEYRALMDMTGPWR